MKKTALTVATIVFGLIVLLVFGVQFIQLVKANGLIAKENADEPPVITVESPLNNDLFSSDTVVVSFTLTKPEYGWVNSLSGNSSKVDYVVVTLNGTRYDRIAVNSDLSVPFTYSLNLTDLKDGLHNVQLNAHCTDVHAIFGSPGGLHESVTSYYALSDIISFTVDTPPVVSILSLENKVYKTNNIPLDFAVDEPASKIEYCIDGKERLVIDGNVTLTGLSDGLHSVVVYATDVDGHVGVSEAAYFEIEAFPTSLVIASSVTATVVLVAIGLLFYFIKRR